ncbi:uncharacterized protein BDZ99DRAFT_569126 [Mytilinidion resinicola]|uniref:Mediator of RNA polymerase II transcription subunit 1 n=1 Tax=Mytilinidion resinicola TaxID=574789 RepID=A0A6A6YUJ7_9PEZI|nr:uncharacterized protein BDZ99DRAFT_569126 [Mytilinidion resinicola]KAF2812451.1 hypothetical protein BDZ99DRAFT_569126 [Mytilinidion resinicola]
MATPTPSTSTPQKHLAAFSSPAPRSVPGMINFDSPAALGLSLEGGVGMGISMSGLSGLGLTGSSMGGRADDDERRRRLEAIIATLRARPGRVSQEGVERLSKRCGLDFSSETQKNGQVIKAIAGKSFILDVTFDADTVERVKFESVYENAAPFSKTAGKTLRKNLSPTPEISRINLTLDRFAHNLERLARMDRLSSQDVSCFEAVSGVYKSLKKLFDYEKQAAKTLINSRSGNIDEKAEREVLSKKSGRPRMNAGECVGLSLEYWMDRRHVLPRLLKTKQKAALDKNHMDVDSDGSDTPSEPESELNKIYSLSIECEPSPATIYQPIRVSDAWISEQVEKPAGDPENMFQGPSIDWLEPPSTYINPPGAEDHHTMNIGADGASNIGSLPNVRFVAKLNPPLVVPLSVAVAIVQSLGNEIPQEAIKATTFVGLALRPGEIDPAAVGLAGETTQEIRSEKNVLVVRKDGHEEEHHHANSLYVPKTEYARALDELPFQHPRQLVEILPTLRQYAFLTSLLQSSFPPPPPPTIPSAPPNSSNPPPLPPSPTLQIDLTLHYAQPTPRLTIHLPHPSSPDTSVSTDPLAAILSPAPLSAPLTVAIDVLANAELLVAEQNIVAAEDGAEADAAAVRRVGRALDLSGDVGVWAEWVWGRHGGDAAGSGAGGAGRQEQGKLADGI